MATQEQQTSSKIESMLKDWEEGRNTSPDQRDYVIAGCEVLGIDWHDITPRVEEIADELYEDAGETYVTIPEISQFVLRELKK